MLDLSPGSNPQKLQVAAFITDPLKCVGNKVAGTVLKVGAGGGVDLTGWTAVALYPAADGQVAYNGNAGYIEPIFYGMRNVVLLSPSITQIVASVDCIVCGM